jgi:Tfp pilus assembly protein PilF
MARISLVALFSICLVANFGCGKSGDDSAEAQPEGVTAIEAESPEESAAGESSEKASVEKEALAREMRRAREILDGYRGRGEDLVEARKILIAVLSRDRGYAPAYVELSRIEQYAGYMSGDDFDRTRLINADKFVGRAIVLDPGLSEAHLRRARIRTRLQERDLAAESLATAEALGAAKDEITAIRAQLALDSGTETEALRLAREVIASESAPPTLRAVMLELIAQVLEAGGFRAEAQEALEEVLALDPESAWAHGNFAGFLIRHGDLARAVEHGERAVELMRYPLGLYTLAQAYIARAEQLHSEQRFAEAGRIMERFRERLGAEDPAILRILGEYYYRIFVRTSDPAFLDRAADSYRAALQLDPDQRDIARSLERILQRRSDLQAAAPQ